jgi:hypothetical protein
MVFGTLIAYILFKIVDHIAVKHNIEILKHGVYTDESVDLISNLKKVITDDKPDNHINYRIWIV